MRKLLLLFVMALSTAAFGQDAGALFQQAEAAVKNENYSGALELYLKAYEVYVKAGQAETAEAATCQHKAGYVCNFLQRPAEGRTYTQRALELRKKLFGEKSVDYINSLNNLSLAYSMEENWTQAIALQTRAVELCEQMQQQPDNYGMVAMNLGRYYYITNKFAEAAAAFEKALPHIDKEGELYEKLLTWLGMCYTETKDYENQRRMMDLMEAHNQRELAKPCEEAQCMLERAQYYSSKGDAAHAKEWFLKTLEQPLDAASKAQVMEAYARHLGDVRDFLASAEYYHGAAALIREVQGETEKFRELKYRAALYEYLGKSYEKSISSFQPLIAHYRSQDTPESRKALALCLKGAGNAANAARDYATAINFRHQLVSLYEATDTATIEYPKAILQLATSEKFAKDYDISIEHHRQAMRIFEQRGLAQEYSEAAASLNMCFLYARRRSEFVDIRSDVSQALREARADSLIAEVSGGLKTTREYLGKQVYAHSLATLAGCYGMKGDHVSEISYYRQYVDALRDAVREGFRMQSEAEREVFWSREPNTIGEVLELLAKEGELQAPQRDSLAAIVYDLELLSKGILLNSSIEFENVLKGYGNQHLQDIYAQTKANEAEINRLRGNISSDADMQRILTLTQQNQALQLELYRGCAEYKDFTNYISYGWQQVHSALKDGDLAVEFAFAKGGVFDRDKFFYAIIQSTQLSNPVAVLICSLEELKALTGSDQQFLQPGNPIWGQLASYLSGVRRIYFSADGPLNSTGIEYLLFNGKPLSEQFEVYRLSSTKELCRSRQHVATKKVALFGDIDYDEEPELSTKPQSETRAQIDGDFTPLQNTRPEVEGIAALLKDKGISDVQLLVETEASEDAFQRLSPETNILHVATHGRFIDVKGASDLQSMQNSQLAFAGANLGGVGEADGLVTAAEVAHMNLRQCDLAVLSACETALGKLGGDGVFGLQRGFKNAGVRSLLMSLRNVSDASTAQLMVSFYRYLLEGKTKREALVKAQEELRQQPGFSDPKYWAAFILLDALE